MKATTKRGGARNTGMSLGGASGIAGLSLRWVLSKDEERLYHYACGSWVDASGRQRSNRFSIERNGIAEAVRRALDPRRRAGMPTAGHHKAVAAVQRWMRGAQ